jgi:hypothetical protein
MLRKYSVIMVRNSQKQREVVGRQGAREVPLYKPSPGDRKEVRIFVTAISLLIVSLL